MNLFSRLLTLSFVVMMVSIAPHTLAQAPGVTIETDRPRTGDTRK
jgi:hypothetical protein